MALWLALSCATGCVSCIDKLFGGAVRVNITGMVDNIGLPYFSNNLIHDNRESLDDVPVGIEKIQFKYKLNHNYWY